MAEKVPRRLRRFYRSQGGPEGYDQGQANATDENLLKEEPFSPTGRPMLGEIPTMKYEDLAASKKNEQEKKRAAKENLEKVALEEVEKFKKQYNRLPTPEESDQIADSLYLQFKDTELNPLELGAGVPQNESVPVPHERQRKRDERAQKRTGTAPRSSRQAQQKQPPAIGLGKVSDLLGEESKEAEKAAEKDEFDLGLDEGNTAPQEEADTVEDIGEIESVDLGDKEICPNCGKEAGKIIFCPKCGTAYCDKCAKKDGEQYICPKCGTKTKA